MRLPPPDHFVTGVSIPVAALRTEEDCGVGEFADLPPLGDWCVETGLEIVQLLPVNDTGFNSSPYSALSAFALHPLYLRLQSLPGAGRFAAEIQAFRETAHKRQAGAGGRFHHHEVLSFKLKIAEQLFADNLSAAGADRGFSAWREANTWVPAYCAFSALKRERDNAPWASWGRMENPSEEDISAFWKDHEEECLRVAWIQYYLEKQLSSASNSLAERGVFLKGDVPILMSRESADVWASRRYFDLTALAGAPPDMFSPNGQNWGFPVYDWDRLASEDYRWWKDRLLQAGKFFHALRIDHVLGFFRIWRIPRDEVTGLLGHFSPSAGMTEADLEGLGFDEGRIRWLTLPHISGGELASASGTEAARVAQTYLTRIGGEDLYNISARFDSEAALQAAHEPPSIRDFLLSRHSDRTFLLDDRGMRFPSWYVSRTRAFQSLSDREKAALSDLFARRRRESEEIWEERGRRLLSMLRETTDMLVCAEDLGDVPDCVPRVLADLGILGLRIVRWSREYRKAAAGKPAPFIPPSGFPRLSVCTPSVHDTSTLRGWWEEDPVERQTYFQSVGRTGPCPHHMTPELQQLIISQCLGSASLACVFQIQDLLDLDPELWSSDPGEDRINVPGTVNDRNWTWRMPLTLEDLARRENLARRVREGVARRRTRQLDRGGKR
ncbi:MAG: 4-alpha-glucanotransferase [Spirochaetia bacterium]|jgi:4-alpha-glucanotransferase